MSTETWLRIILAVLSAAIYVNHHWLHRSPGVRHASRVLSAHRFGNIEFWVAATALLWTASLVLYIALGPLVSIPLPRWSRWVGVAGMLVCMPLSQWTYTTLGRHFSKKLELRADHELVRIGPYRYVRHPMYATLFLCAFSTCLVSTSALVLATTVAVAVVFVLRLQKEEAMLIGKFGDEYLQYKRSTAALVPKVL